MWCDTRLSFTAKAPGTELTGVTVMVAVVRLPGQLRLGSHTLSQCVAFQHTVLCHWERHLTIIALVLCVCVCVCARAESSKRAPKYVVMVILAKLFTRLCAHVRVWSMCVFVFRTFFLSGMPEVWPQFNPSSPSKCDESNKEGELSAWAVLMHCVCVC